jgi:Holliday junction DNA helicase RuvA
MIGKLKGVIDSQGDDHVILDVGGVGYLVQCSGRTLQTLPGIGEWTALAIETQVREDAIRLFGFASAGERDWFRLLQSVQGVGAKVALAVLSVLSPGELSLAVLGQDKATIALAPGVGPKLAARIVAELKDRAAAFGQADSLPVAMVPGADGKEPAAIADAISALVNLGYARPQVMEAVRSSARALGDAAETAALIRRGLKELTS